MHQPLGSAHSRPAERQRGRRTAVTAGELGLVGHPAMVDAMISVDEGGAAAGTGGGGSPGAEGTHAGVVGSSFATVNSSADLAPILRNFADYGGAVRVHLIDGTYELFRQHFGSAAHHTESVPYAATIGVVGSTLQLVTILHAHRGRHRHVTKLPTNVRYKPGRMVPMC